ncbi:aminotransferase class V-fold PLP-dependent enzyme [Pararhodonellum marinum]|uniref:aminotransferase class V-fold PLP-dependent enzyme n=1 Tax=Pararhodonellum marinum TaxID=2755358 RepID=UPI00188F77C1|nr:aminotransferase class V-fold PLP-dependent enzyme [Pararhodonellum marinum]
MVTFSPGPSKVYDTLPLYLKEAFEMGIMSISHRSAMFMDLYQETETLIKEQLHVPQDYKLLFTSSATENWEIIAQSVTESASFHIFSGSFGKKWYEFAKYIEPKTGILKLEPDQTVDVTNLDIGYEFDLIAITQNETSNATQVSNETIAAIAHKFPEKMMAIDTTSSMAGIELDFSLADIWYASVQKCFGMPAGLGVLLLSPKAIQKVKKKGERGRYNSLSFMLENAENFQTHYTPNVLGIYLLKRVLQDIPEIQHIDQKTRSRMQQLENAIANTGPMRMLIQNPEARSSTVLAVTAREPFISQIKKDAEVKGMQLGGGYGPLKASSFRIANFPAINDREFENLLRFLKEY